MLTLILGAAALAHQDILLVALGRGQEVSTISTKYQGRDGRHSF